MLNFNKLLLGSAGLLALATFQANASPITDLFNTGVDASGATLADGSIDSHYVITASPDGTSTETAKTSASGFPIGPWLGDDTLSDWIGETAGYPALNEGVGTFDNTTTFTTDFTGQVVIHGKWASDNEAPAIILNGVTVNSGNSNGFASFTPFTITAIVTAGIQTLDFQTHNDGGPGGVRVEFTSISPEPASISLFGLGGLGLLARRRKA